MLLKQTISISLEFLAGAPHRFTYKTIQESIRKAGFEPQLRRQDYTFREIPEGIEEQVINY
jgi:cyclic dehypoxanthinyl futalosine synthase